MKFKDPELFMATLREAADDMYYMGQGHKGAAIDEAADTITALQSRIEALEKNK